MKHLAREIKELPLYPLLPFVPMAILGGTLALSALSFARLCKIERALDRALPPASA